MYLTGCASFAQHPHGKDSTNQTIVPVPHRDSAHTCVVQRYGLTAKLPMSSGTSGMLESHKDRSMTGPVSTSAKTQQNGTRTIVIVITQLHKALVDA